MVVLCNGDLRGCGPRRAATEAIPPCGFGFVFRSFPVASRAVVVHPDWMETMGATICSHVP